MSGALDQAVAAVHRSGDAAAIVGVRLLVREHDVDVAARLLCAPDGDGRPLRARIEVRLRDVLEQRGGSIARHGLVQHLAEVLDEPHHVIRAAIDDGSAPGGYLELVWADPADDGRHTLSIRRPGL